MQFNEDMKREIRKCFNFYEQHVLPVIKSNNKVTLSDFGFHGLYTHTDSVVFRGIYYAFCLNENPIPVIFSCAFHDLARTDDEYNEIHGKRALPIAKEVMKNFPDILTDKEQDSILYAVENHTTGRDAPDYISACLWDADRTRLGWIYGYRECFMTTDEAKMVASGDAIKFLKFQNECLGRDLNEDREGVLSYYFAKIHS